jgi:hypothetical protein
VPLPRVFTYSDRGIRWLSLNSLSSRQSLHFPKGMGAMGQRNAKPYYTAVDEGRAPPYLHLIVSKPRQFEGESTVIRIVTYIYLLTEGNRACYRSVCAPNGTLPSPARVGASRLYRIPHLVIHAFNSRHFCNSCALTLPDSTLPRLFHFSASRSFLIISTLLESTLLGIRT